MSKVSVIVPIYNVENYLKRCLDSLSRQTEKDFEVIMINDGSTDGSCQIATSFAERDPRFKLFHETNQGEAAARNLGLDKASGEYIMFLDADDYYTDQCIEKALMAIRHFNCDITVFGSTYKDEDGNLVKEACPVRTGRYLLSEHPEILMEIENCVWDKIYRRELFAENGIRYLPGFYTDFSGTFRIVVTANTISFINDKLINYFVGRKGSITAQFSTKCFSIFEMTDSIIDFYKQKNIYDLYKEEIKAQAILNIIDKMKLAVTSDNKELRDSFIKKSYEYMLSTFGDIRSKYKLSRYKGDFIYFHPQLLKLYLILKGKK